MKYLILLTALLLTLSLKLSTSSAAPGADEPKKTNQVPGEKAAQARLYKDQGEKYVAQDKTEQAAEAFSKALALGRETFSPMERVRMAIYLSWADRLQEAESELKLVLAADPKNIAARTHLARVLGWSGKLAESIAQADTALQEAPNDRDALLVKADSLRWQGREREALPIYQKLAARGDNFDARIGLAYALLATGRPVEAEEEIQSLKPANTRQGQDLKKLVAALNLETRPSTDFRYNYYRDSDGNRENRYSLQANFLVGNEKLGMNFRHTDASDAVRDNRAEDLSFKIYSNLTESIAAGASIGFTQLGDGHTSNFPVGQLRTDAKLFDGTLSANVTREVLTDTAELIENRIRVTNFGWSLLQPLADRFSVYGGYAYKDISDNNHANDLQLGSQYTIYLNPRISVGYRFRYLDFLKQTHDGYFDPNNYIANRVATSLYLERPTYYTYLEAFVGYETFRRDGATTQQFVKGGSGSIGIKPLPNLAIEVNAEGGNFAAGSVSGFAYFIVGPRLLFRF